MGGRGCLKKLRFREPAKYKSINIELIRVGSFHGFTTASCKAISKYVKKKLRVLSENTKQSLEDVYDNQAISIKLNAMYIFNKQ